MTSRSIFLPLSAGLARLFKREPGRTLHSRLGREVTISVNFRVERLEERIALSTTDVIRNGSFTAPVSTTDWMCSKDFFADDRFTNAHSSGGYAYLSNPDGSPGNSLQGTVYQQVTIPGNSTIATLRFWYNISTDETTTTLNNDTMAVQIQNTSGSALANISIYSNLNKTTQYTQSPSFSLLDWAGQTVRLAFVGATNSTLPTVFRVDDVSLIVTTPVPSATTQPATNVTSTSAQLNGTVNPNGTRTSAYFEYGSTTNYGGTTEQVVLGSGTGATPATATLGQLNEDTTFHFRVVAVNSYGDTTYGDDSTFTTNVAPTITLIAPNAGAIWRVGTDQTITWTVSGDTSQISYVSVFLSTDSGINYTAISPNLSLSTVSLNYLPVTSNISSSAVIWVRAFNPSGTPLAGASSNEPFTIANPPPIITSISPSSGSTAGGDAVTIFGTYLTYATSVTFDGVAAAISYNSETGDLTAVTPAHATGVVDLAVTTLGGETTLKSSYTYINIAAPTITLNSPNAGAVWQLDVSQTISWSITGDLNEISSLSVLFSPNNGASFYPIDTNLSASASSIAYTPTSPQVSNQALISVQAFNAAGSILASAASSGAFTVGIPAGYAPQQIRHFYGLDSIAFNDIPGDGTGQTIAIIDPGNDPTLRGDVHTFDEAEGITIDPNLTIVAENGSSNLPTSNAGTGEEVEEAMDVEWAHVIAPMANILLVEAATLSVSDVTAAVNTAKNWPGVSVVSMSFGGSETSVQYPEALFTPPSGGFGVTFIASSGDGGSYPGNPGLVSAGNVVNSPASSPNVLTVGGTTLLYDQNGNPLTEIGWGYLAPLDSRFFIGSGGGKSSLYAEPSWQTPVAGGVLDGMHRGVPDVAFEGDAGTGVQIYASGFQGWVRNAGTSLGAPCWAAIMAIVNQGRAILGRPTLNRTSDSTLAAIYALPAADFNDITSGTNGGYTCITGYDLVTGRGTPIANRLIPDLVAADTASTTTTIVTNNGLTTYGQPLTFTAVVASGAGSVETGTVQFQIDGSNAGSPVLLDTATGTASFTISTLKAGNHSIVAVYEGDSAYNGSTSAALTQMVEVAVTQVKVNGNNSALVGAQRSMVNSVVYSFSEPVNITATGAFSIAVTNGQTGTLPTLLWAPIDPDGNGASTQWAVTFGGAGVNGGSIANGVYDITINASGVTSEAAGAQLATGQTDTFWRLFGDLQGNKTVNSIDKARFNLAFGTSAGAANYIVAFDSNSNNTVDSTDKGRFNLDFGITYTGFTSTI